MIFWFIPHLFSLYIIFLALIVLAEQVTSLTCSSALFRTSISLQPIFQRQSQCRSKKLPYKPCSPRPQERCSGRWKVQRCQKSHSYVVVILWSISVACIVLWEIVWAWLWECAPGQGCVRNTYSGKSKFPKSRAEDQGCPAFAFGGPASAAGRCAAVFQKSSPHTDQNSFAH